jgi:hypothetical protein
MNRRFYLTAALFLQLCAQLAVATEPRPDLIESFRNINVRNLQAHLRFLSSDEMQGRETGTQFLDIAARYLESQFSIAGLTPIPGQASMLQTFAIDRNKRVNSSLLITNGPRSLQGRDFRFLTDFFPVDKRSVSITLEAPVTFAEIAQENDIDIKGHFVLFISTPTDDEQQSFWLRSEREFRIQKAEWARGQGAAGAVFCLPELDSRAERRLLRASQREYYKLNKSPDEFPRILITRQVLGEMLAPIGWTTETLKALNAKKISNPGLKNLTFRLHVDVESDTLVTQNVVAFLQGSDADLQHEAVIFGAHYDHVGAKNGAIYNGADDDASGTAALLEIARTFSAGGTRPRRSLIFVAHSAEEHDLLGSSFYSFWPAFPLENTVAMLNMDMIGRNEEDEIFIIGSDFLSRRLHEINESANERVGLRLDYSYNNLDDPNQFYYRSDHYNYAKYGIPSIFYFNGTHDDYHQPTDTFEKINFRKVVSVTRLVFLTGLTIAELDERPPLDGIFSNY